MRIRWDKPKRRRVLQTRQIDFALLENLLRLPYIEDVRSEDPEQYRLIGFAEGKLTTFIVEYRSDEVGPYIWIITAWRATGQEARDYEDAIH
jgi:uncharacterized DUF497 family protein